MIALFPLLAACGPAALDTAPRPVHVTLGETVRVIPGEGLPTEAQVLPANNNLDVVAHDGRLFLAWRTAPTHFADEDVWLQVISTTDEQSWRFEGSFFLGTDLREPRFLSWEGALFLYFAVLGTDPLAFEPQGSKVTRYGGEGVWSEPVDFMDPSFIPWRTKVVDGAPYMLGYVGGGEIYEFEEGGGVDVHFLTTEDGLDWTPVVEGQPVVTSGGGSETAFVFMDDGALLAVQRNELGDEMGWGSKICAAPADALADWTCAADDRKYDSPLMFRYGERAYLIARRNVTDTGAYDLGFDDLDHTAQTLAYQLDYWQQPKRCALWEVHAGSLTVEHLLDLPSRGDTCFPGLIDHGGGDFTVYNYSSPVDGSDISWVEGQNGDTNIYRTPMRFRSE